MGWKHLTVRFRCGEAGVVGGQSASGGQLGLELWAATRTAEAQFFKVHSPLLLQARRKP